MDYEELVQTTIKHWTLEHAERDVKSMETALDDYVTFLVKTGTPPSASLERMKANLNRARTRVKILKAPPPTLT